jgi:hypothetical protein
MNTMASRHFPRPSPLARALACALLALAAGCGPGVGGTGTGTEAAFAELHATPAAVCDGPLAGSLSCRNDGLPASGPTGGSAAVLLADNTVLARVRARVQGNSIELMALCDGIGFSGDWGQVPGLGLRFVGQTRQGQTATLTVQAQDGGPLLLQLFDAQGQALWGPVLVRTVQATPPPACGS